MMAYDLQKFAPEISFGFFVIGWFLVCWLLYRHNRFAAWLAGASVSGCLFFLGVTLAASYFVPEAFFLSLLWSGIILLLVIHLRAARNETRLKFATGTETSTKINPTPGWSGSSSQNLI